MALNVGFLNVRCSAANDWELRIMRYEHRLTSIAICVHAVLPIFALGPGVDWLETHNTTVDAMPAAIFAICFEQVSAWLVKLLLPRNVSIGLPWH
jgi:hypothetical protein